MKILIAVDGSSYSRMAIEFLASRKTLMRSKPDVQVLNVQWSLPPHPARIVGMSVVRDYYADEAEKALGPARSRLQRAGLSALVRHTVGRPATEIGSAADKDKVDLLVLGSHGHSALAGMLLGSVTNEVLVRSSRPTLIVRGKTKKYPDSLRVGIAIDGSAYGVAALKYVLRHAQFFGAAPTISLIHVVHSYDLVGIPSVAGFAPPAFTAAEVRAMQDKAYEAAMRPVRRTLKNATGAKASEVRLTGIPSEELTRYASKKLDVLAMGSHGYGALKGAVLGSVATSLVAHGEVPLLLIRKGPG